MFDAIEKSFDIAQNKLAQLHKKYSLDKIDLAYRNTLERCKTEEIKNPAGYFIKLVSDPEYGEKEAREKNKKKQLKEQEIDEKTAEQEQLRLENEKNEKTEKWIEENRELFLAWCEEERLKLEGNNMAEKNRINHAKILAKVRVRAECI